MGDGMPYHLEKGPTLRILEEHLNRPLAERVVLLDRLRAGGFAWFVDDYAPNNIPSLWDHPAFDWHPLGNGQAVRDDILRRWFGWAKDAAGNWVDVDLNEPTTGYWIAYKGDPLSIVREALAWALEISLGIEHGAPSTGATRPDLWPIELFWKCPAPWFEAWVTVQPVTGQQSAVTVELMTPSHLGSNVAESPVAWSPTVKPAGFTHPIPSTGPDYLVLQNSGSADEQNREYAMWVVTHHDHVRDTTHPKVTTDTVTMADFAEWGIPKLSIYKGIGDPVIVSPSLPAGGVRTNGAVP